MAPEVRRGYRRRRIMRGGYVNGMVATRSREEVRQKERECVLTMMRKWPAVYGSSKGRSQREIKRHRMGRLLLLANPTMNRLLGTAFRTVYKVITCRG